MAGKKRGSVLWSHHIQALVDDEVNTAIRTYAAEAHNGSISTAARTAMVEHLRDMGYLSPAS